MKLRKYVYDKIVDIINYDYKTAIDEGIAVTSIQVSQELFGKLRTYTLNQGLQTHGMKGKGGYSICIRVIIGLLHMLKRENIT